MAKKVSASISIADGCRYWFDSGQGSMNWKRISRISDDSLSFTGMSSDDIKGGTANAAVVTSRYFLWVRKCTLSEDSKTTSAAGSWTDTRRRGYQCNTVKDSCCVRTKPRYPVGFWLSRFDGSHEELSDGVQIWGESYHKPRRNGRPMRENLSHETLGAHLLACSKWYDIIYISRKKQQWRVMCVISS